MGDNGDYYGYDSADNTKLADLRYQGRHMGENFTEYGDSSVGSSHFEGYRQTYKPPSGGDPNDPSSTNYDYWSKKDAYGRTGASGDGVEAIYHRIMAQDPDKVQALMTHWRGVAEALSAVSDTIKAKTDGVSSKWQSPGASQFMALGPGAAMKSVNDWYLAAIQTAVALSVVHGSLIQNRALITALYNEYKAEVGAYQDKIGGTGIDSARDIKGDKYGFSQRYTQYVAEIQQKYTYRAQVIESSLGDAYWDGYNGVVGSTPGIYEGPTNAVAAPPANALNLPGFPGGGPGAPGAVPPGLAPSGPPVAPNAVAPAPPAAPIAPGKAPVAPVAPVAPGGPGAGPVPVVPGATPPAPIAPGTPVAPVAPGTPVAARALPVLPIAPAVMPPGKPGAPVAPGMPGALPTGAPGQPALPKALAKGGVLGQPGAGNLPPNPGGGRTPPSPASPRLPAAQQARLARPVLGGSNPSAPPGMPGGARQPGAPGAPGARRPGAPGMPGASRQPGAPGMPGARRPGAPGAPGMPGARQPGVPGMPGGLQGGRPGSLPASPFGNSTRPAAPPVLGGRAARPGEPGYLAGRPGTPEPRLPGMPGGPGSREPGSRVPGMPGGPGPGVPGGPGSRFSGMLGGSDGQEDRAPQAPGAIPPVLNRPEKSPPEQDPGAPRQGRRFSLRRLLPGGLSDPFGLTSRSAPAGPVLNPSVGPRPVTSAAAGVPGTLRGTSPLTPASPDPSASRPVVEADLAARHVEPTDTHALRDEDVFVPQTPGGPVLAHGKRPRDYEAEERIALPGSG
ncbi:hypothetical protein [Cryptosporangium sp. NPDC048952]|uniref:hypothetical protein n=1 Tax=Cryptosporangium sp. NPDC048952 TaxID=3363961 RepID=UPI0037229EA3